MGFYLNDSDRLLDIKFYVKQFDEKFNDLHKKILSHDQLLTLHENMQDLEEELNNIKRILI